MVGVYSIELDANSLPAEAAEMVRGKTIGELRLEADGSFEGSVDVMGRKDKFKGNWQVDGDKFTMNAVDKKRVLTRVGTIKNGVISVPDNATPPATMILKKK